MVPNEAWPRLPESIINALPEHERELIRQHVEEMIVGNSLQTDDLVRHCNNKFQFAKTYRVLRRDKRNTLDMMRKKMAKPNPAYSDSYGVAMMRSIDDILDYKLERIARYFEVRWGESIENYAGKEGAVIDRVGCCVAFVALISAMLASAAAVAFLLAYQQ